MIELHGKYNKAKIFTDNTCNNTISQVQQLVNQQFIQGSKVRIMPDTHAGKGCVIGTTLTVKDKVVPNLVGVDIGCGMITLNLGKISPNLELLDDYIRNNIPHGFKVNSEEKAHKPLEKLKCKSHINISRAKKSIGTLGGGNHFIEMNKDSQDNIYLIIHSGSRNLGKQVAEYYQDLANKNLPYIIERNQEVLNQKIQELKNNNKDHLIQDTLKELNVQVKIPEYLAYLEGENFDDYIHDMKIVQEYAETNRLEMALKIIQYLGIHSLEIVEQFQTIHNYIDTDDMILRKGAISAKKGEKVLIPLNMRDGSLLAVGKGNLDWNESAPHGAGRLMSRSKAKEVIDLSKYEKSMEHIYTTSVNESTLDEAPEAYKPMQEIIDNTSQTIEIIEHLRPIYNFKSSTKKKNSTLKNKNREKEREIQLDKERAKTRKRG